MKTMAQIINQMSAFSPDEFPEYALDHTQAIVLMKLQNIRDRWGKPIYPSRHPDGWARFEGSDEGSRHYAVGRKSDAGDFFPAGNVFEFWLMMQEMNWGGIGIYFDTRKNRLQPGPMIHGDCRDTRVLWCRINGIYYYLNIGADDKRCAHLRFMEAVENYVRYGL